MTRKPNPKTGRPRATTRTAGRRAASGNDPDKAIEFLKASGVRVRLRRGQRLALKVNRKETLYFVESGLLLVTATVPGRARQILGLIYPGDVIRSSAVPEMADIGLIASCEGEVLRLPWSAISEDASAEPGALALVHDRCASLQARLVEHIARLGGLNGEQRLASLLVEFADRFGQQSRGGTFVDVPLSRVDIADYLALNADTLSRIVTRLKASGAVTWISRNRVVINDWEALRDRSSLVATDRGLGRNGKAQR